MKKNKLFTILAAITLLTGVGAEASANLNANVVQAAKRTKKSKGRKKTTRRSKKTSKKRTSKKTRKAAPYAIVRIRRGAPVYIIKFNKAGTAVSKIYRQKKTTFRAIRAYAYWWTRYRGVSYYYLPGVRSGKYKQIAVRTKDAKVTTKKKPFSLDAQTKKVNKVKARAAYWNRTLNAARPKAYSGTIKTNTPYLVFDQTGKSHQGGTLNTGNSVNVVFQIDLSGTENGQSVKIPMYAVDLNNSLVYVPTQAVTINNGASIPSYQGYTSSVKNFESLVARAKKEGFVFRTAK